MRDLEQETGHAVGWKQVGSLIVAKSEDRMIQLQRTWPWPNFSALRRDLIVPEGSAGKMAFVAHG